MSKSRRRNCNRALQPPGRPHCRAVRGVKHRPIFNLVRPRSSSYITTAVASHHDRSRGYCMPELTQSVLTLEALHLHVALRLFTTVCSLTFLAIINQVDLKRSIAQPINPVQILANLCRVELPYATKKLEFRDAADCTQLTSYYCCRTAIPLACTYRSSPAC